MSKQATKKYKPKYKIREPTKPPDIAFWFDEKDPTFYYFKIRENTPHVSLLMAAFDLLVTAIKTDAETVIGETEEE